MINYTRYRVVKMLAFFLNFSKGDSETKGGFLTREATKGVRFRHIQEDKLSEMEPKREDSTLKIAVEAGDISSDDDAVPSAILKQVSGPFIVSGLAMVIAGVYFDTIQDWEALKKIPEIIVLVPALLGLKGNLEMTLAARLSTEANLGLMNNANDHVNIISGNIALVQLQAIVLAILTCTAGCTFIFIGEGFLIPRHIIVLYASCIATASVASFILTLLTAFIIILSVSFKINPDNIATPIAASLGDITSLLLISLIASAFYKTIENFICVPIFIIILYVALLPLFFWLAKNNRHTTNVVASGWIPIIFAMLISTLGGIALKRFIERFHNLPAFQPVMNGVGGNLVSILASRLSTALHMKSHLGDLPEDTKIFILPSELLFSKESYAVTSRVLFCIALPGHALFALIIMLWQTDFSVQLFGIFLFMYLVAALSQVFILLYCAYIITHFVWKWSINPDTTTIPYLTALGDFLGILFLGSSFCLIEYSGYAYDL